MYKVKLFVDFGPLGDLVQFQQVEPLGPHRRHKGGGRATEVTVTIVWDCGTEVVHVGVSFVV